MFERFTNRARRVVVLAQDEARGLQHSYIGTEHLLLGLIGEGGGVAAQALERFNMPLTEVREEVKQRVGTGDKPERGRIPFTPRAKKVLEYGLREALALRHDYIGTEHILLGLLKEGEGIGAQIVRSRAGDLLVVRMAVLDLVPAAPPLQGHRWLRRRGGAIPRSVSDEPGQQHEPVDPSALFEESEEVRTTPAAGKSLAEALRLAGTQAVGSHHLLLAALGDADTAVARVLAAQGVDLDRAKEALRKVDIAGTSDEQPEEAGRRHMVIRVTDDRLTLEVSDQAIIALGRAAADALGDRGGEPGTIGGSLPVSSSLSNVWQALRDSLDDIRRRAAMPAGGPVTEDPPAQEAAAGGDG